VSNRWLVSLGVGRPGPSRPGCGAGHRSQQHCQHHRLRRSPGEPPLARERGHPDLSRL